MTTLKRMLKIPRVRVILALVAIGLVTVIAFFAPKEPDPNIGLNNDPAAPTIGITNPVGSLTVNRSLTYNNVQFTVTQTQEAGAFSDDRKRTGMYTVRVQVHVQPGKQVQSPVGIDFASLVHLILPNGQSVSPKLVNLSPVVLPQQSSDGYFDFPVSTQISLSTLTLTMGSSASVSFSETNLTPQGRLLHVGMCLVDIRAKEIG